MKFKKGAIEIQFNWLFVLIIGAVILIIFSGIIVRQKNVSEGSKNVLILNNLDAILSGSEASSGTVSVLKIPETTIDFKCNRYSIGSFSKQLEIMNVFTPSSLHGDRIIAMTSDFSMPFRITNIVYLTSPKYRYILVGNTEASDQIKKIMPNETFTENFENIQDAKFRGEENSRFIFFNNFLQDGQDLDINLKEYVSLQDSRITALNVRGDTEKGEIEFFEKRNGKFLKTGSSYYAKKETLLGAVFSDSPEIYECVMNNIFKKISIVTQVYSGKLEEIRNFYSQGSNRCLMDDIYSSENLNKILGASSSFTFENILAIIGASQNLQEQNKQAQLQSCATIY